MWMRGVECLCICAFRSSSSIRHMPFTNPSRSSEPVPAGSHSILQARGRDADATVMARQLFYCGASMTTVRGDEAKIDQYVLFKSSDKVRSAVWFRT